MPMPLTLMVSISLQPQHDRHWIAPECCDVEATAGRERPDVIQTRWLALRRSTECHRMTKARMIHFG